MNENVRISPAGSGAPTRIAWGWERLRPWLVGILSLVLAVAVLHALRTVLAEVSYADIVNEVAAMPTPRLVWAFLATALSFLALSGYDASGLRYVGARVKRSAVVLISFIAYALGNTIGLGVLTGGAVRMRLYTAAGVEPGKIVSLIAFNATAFGLGMTAFGAAGLL